MHEKPREFYIKTIKAGLRRARKASKTLSGAAAPRDLAVVLGYSPSIVEACWALGFKTVIALTDAYWKAEESFETITHSQLRTTVTFKFDSVQH